MCWRPVSRTLLASTPIEKRVVLDEIKRTNLRWTKEAELPGQEGTFIMIWRLGTIMVTPRKSAFRFSGSSCRPAYLPKQAPGTTVGAAGFVIPSTYDFDLTLNGMQSFGVTPYNYESDRVAPIMMGMHLKVHSIAPIVSLAACRCVLATRCQALYCTS